LDDGASPDGNSVVSDTTPVVTEPFTVDLSTIADDPGLSTGHILRIRWAKNSGGGGNKTIRIELREGYVNESTQGTLIATDDYAINSTTLRTDETTLSGAEANAITDYADLQIRVMGVAGNRALKVDFVELEAPNLTPIAPERLVLNTKSGPFARSADDNLYMVMNRNNASFFDQVTIWRSTNNGVVWTAIDDIDPVGGVSDSNISSMAAVAEGDILHIIWTGFDTGTSLWLLNYVTYNMATETPATAEEIEASILFQWLAIGVRSDSDVVIAIENTDARITLWRGSAGSWTEHIDFGTTDIEFASPAMPTISIADNDDAHVFWFGAGTVGKGVHHRVLRADYTESTAETVTTTGPIGQDRQRTGQSVIFHNKLHVLQLDASLDLVAWSADVAEEPTWSSETIGVDNDVIHGAMLGLFSAGGRMAAVWVRSTDQDIRYTVYESGWGTEQSASDTTPDTADSWRDWRAFVRDGSVYMAGFTKIDSSQNTRYHEFLLGVVVANGTGIGHGSAYGTVTATIVESTATAAGHAVSSGTAVGAVVGAVQADGDGHATASGTSAAIVRQFAAAAGFTVASGQAMGDSIGPIDAVAIGQAVGYSTAVGVSVGVGAGADGMRWGINASVS
jgi:hypothetical protein